MLMTRSAIEAAETVRPSDFYVPVHSQVFEAIMGLYERGEPVDLVTVAAEAEAHRNGSQKVTKQKLLELLAAAPASANSLHYARIVTDLGAKRALDRGLLEARDLVHEPDLPAAECVARAHDLIRDADLPIEGGLMSPTIDEFVETAEDPLPWVIPGTLRRRERLMIVAEPGLGKTTLARQIAVQVSQGIHPWKSWETLDPVRVLFIDLENERAGSRQELREMTDKAALRDLLAERTPYDSGRLRFEFRPEGIDVLHRGDQLWLTERIAANKPDVVVLGPVYKLHNIDDNSAQESKSVLQVLDRLRIRYGFALVMETHAPIECWMNQGTKRKPLRIGGSRVWTQWPEFVAGLTPESNQRTVYWTHVRPPRYRNRAWPQRMHRDGRTWPWEPDDLY
jgi:replicative DNA helicase